MKECWDCGKPLEKGLVRCKVCQGLPVSDENSLSGAITWRMIPGYNCPGDNVGLGYVKNKADYKNKCKLNGAIPEQ